MQLETRVNVQNHFWKLTGNGYRIKLSKYNKFINLSFYKGDELLSIDSSLNVREAVAAVTQICAIYKSALETDEDRAQLDAGIKQWDKDYKALIESVLGTEES